MSADPYIQAPYNLKSFNRYSYVWNNPLRLVDLDGYNALDTNTGSFITNDPTAIAPSPSSNGGPLTSGITTGVSQPPARTVNNKPPKTPVNAPATVAAVNGAVGGNANRPAIAEPTEPYVPPNLTINNVEVVNTTCYSSSCYKVIRQDTLQVTGKTRLEWRDVDWDDPLLPKSTIDATNYLPFGMGKILPNDSLKLEWASQLGEVKYEARIDKQESTLKLENSIITDQSYGRYIKGNNYVWISNPSGTETRKRLQVQGCIGSACVNYRK